MKATKFDPGYDLVVVQGRVWNRRGRSAKLWLAVDTAAGQTIISPEVLDELGYSAREHGEQVAITRSVVGREEGYMLRVARFDCLGFQEPNFQIFAQDLPSGWDIAGLLGLSFLRQFNYEVRSVEGRIMVERAA
jgi:hypothetical protein